jgi:DNA repair protein RecO (recombination protein O)
LLDELGYKPALDVCAVCDRRLEPVTNYWSPAAGGVVCPSCSDQALAFAPLSLNGFKLLRLLQRGTFAEAARIRLSGELSRELEACLAEQVRFVLEREVRSARFVEQLRKTPAREPLVDQPVEQ